jgi:hypothetical protein
VIASANWPVRRAVRRSDGIGAASARRRFARRGVLALTRCSRNHHDGPEHQPGEVIDRDACMGSGNYLFCAPDILDLDDDANFPTEAFHPAGILPS